MCKTLELMFVSLYLKLSGLRYNLFTMKISIKFLFALLILLPAMLTAEEILRSQTSWDGGEIEYPAGQAEITSFILRLEEGSVPKFHCHPVPTFGYVLHGEVEIETLDGNKTILKQGESAIEVMRTVHRGRAIGGPAQIVVFYAGAVDVPNNVFPEDDPQGQHCNL